jgi:arginine exporter protein ArgO
LGLFAIFGGTTSLIGGVDTLAEVVVVVAAIMSGSMIWWAALSQLISRLRHKLTERRLRIMNQVAGSVLIVFAGLLFVQVMHGLSGHRL